MEIKYWIIKSEPNTYSIDDLKREGFTSWEGVRNYQARNFIRDQMKYGDLVLFYHSNAKPPGVAGLCRICKEAHPDVSARDPTTLYFDEKATVEKPIWFMVEVEYVESFSHFISLPELKKDPRLATLEILKTGNRLSITPVSKEHFDLICHMGRTN